MASLRLKEVVELGGMAAFLLGMYFVYAEIQQNGVIARAELSTYSNQRMYELRNRFLDREFSALYLKGLRTPAELDESERHQLNAFYEGIRLIMAYEYRNYRLGLFLDYEGMTQSVARQFLAHGYGRAWWNTRKVGMNPNIVNVVDEELSNLDGSERWSDFDSKVLNQIEALQ